MTERQVTDQSDFETEAPKSEGMGGIGADFVATLGRRVADARTLLPTLTRGEGNAANLAEMRRKLHAVSAGAKLLKFDIMASSLGEALAIIDRASGSASTVANGAGGTGKPSLIAEKDAAILGQLLDDLPALAWSESRSARRKSQGNREGAPKLDDVVLPLDSELPYTSLVVGAQSLVEALSEDTGSGRASFECERSDDVQVAIDRARSLAPDVIVLDADVKDAELFLEALADDEVTEPVPLIVVGTFARPGDAERFVAMGATRTFEKPLIRGTLRRACERAIAQREGKTERLPLGEPTMIELAERLSQEVKQALLADIDGARTCKVPLGDGAEVIGAMWGAIARIREVVTARTDGVVRFSGQGPEGAIALAPWLNGDVARSDRSARSRGASPEVRLHGRKVVVADDDPGVTWFLADLLRAAGCTVHEAMDGRAALELAFRVQPDLVISDILMPGMDGFALCRAMKRDVALRDTPVVLLSWKEDLLQRVRELGASAAAYMRKESDSRAIVARVREVLKSRARVEARLRAEDEVRGRLDGLTVRSLLEIVCGNRRSARISLRDASFLYEIEVREGVPFRASRASSDGKLRPRRDGARSRARRRRRSLHRGAEPQRDRPRSEGHAERAAPLPRWLVLARPPWSPPAPRSPRSSASRSTTTRSMPTSARRPSRAAAGWPASPPARRRARILLEGARRPDVARRPPLRPQHPRLDRGCARRGGRRSSHPGRRAHRSRDARRGELASCRQALAHPLALAHSGAARCQRRQRRRRDRRARVAVPTPRSASRTSRPASTRTTTASATTTWSVWRRSATGTTSRLPPIPLARKTDTITPSYGSIAEERSSHGKSADETDVDDAPVGMWDLDGESIPITLDPSQPSKRVSQTTAPSVAKGGRAWRQDDGSEGRTG